jgi:hypothetical protein
LVESRCPAFSWAGDEVASGYELVVLAVPGDELEGAGALRVVSRILLSQGARSWTPSLGQCLERGGQYAWAVRAVTDGGEGHWSEPALFRVAPGPSAQEVEAALETLLQHLGERQGGQRQVAGGPPAEAFEESGALVEERLRERLSAVRERRGSGDDSRDPGAEEARRPIGGPRPQLAAAVPTRLVSATTASPRFAVDSNGTVTIGGLPTAALQDELVCFDSASGEIGRCAQAGGLSAFGYVFNTSAQTVGINEAVEFDTNGLLTGLTHVAGEPGIVIGSSGVHEITFSVSAVEPGQFALFSNGVAIPNAIYGSGAGTQQNNGSVLVDLAAGDVITLKNHTSAAAVGLQTLAGGTEVNVNASIVIKKLD